MNPTIKALRAIGSEFAWRVYLPILMIAISIAALFIGMNIWLITLSAWWWILFMIVLGASLIAAIILFFVGLLTRIVRPTQTKKQKHQVKQFVDKIQNVADLAGTPKFLILFRVTRDLISKNEDTYTRRISSETLSMQHDLRNLIDGFK